MELSLYLTQLLEDKRSLNPRYSLRAFSRDLGVNPSHLSQVIANKIEPSENFIKKVAISTKTDRSKFTRVSKASFFKKPWFFKAKDNDYKYSPGKNKISWKHHAVLETFKIQDNNLNVSFINQKLNIKNNEAKAILWDLLEWGYLEKTKDGYQSVNTNTYLNNQTNEDKKVFQQDIIENSKLSIDKVDIKERDHSTMTMAISKSQVPEAKQLIKKFRRELCAYLQDNKDQDAVYHLNIGFFPSKDYLNEDS